MKCLSTTTGSRELSFEPLEFLARLLQHIPPLGFKAWRQYGAYSAVVRARWRKEREAKGEDATEPTVERGPGRKQCSASWAALLSRTWGFDPLECPDCGSRMEIVATIHDRDSLDRITSHYGLDTCVPELKPARAPPWAQGDLSFDEEPPYESYCIDEEPGDDAYIDPPNDDEGPVFELG